MCYNVTQEQYNLVLIKIALDVCDINLQKEMNVEKYVYIYISLKVHNKNIMQDKSCICVTLTFSFAAITFSFPAILSMFPIICKNDKCFIINHLGCMSG